MKLGLILLNDWVLENVKLITNGFDEDDFNVLKKEDDTFVIGHFGLC